jgi:Pyruvate/2-oxoacid:ferredoxin oxidoreductase delta subunit
MKTRLYVHTGTGNSLWVARQLASHLQGVEIKFMPLLQKAFKIEADVIGIIFPVHIWGLPSRVIQFVNHLKVKPGAFLFAVAVNAGQPAATLLQLRRLMAVRKLTLSLGCSIVLPSNYIPWGGPGPLDKQQKRFKEARAKVKAIAGAVFRRERNKVERGPLWQNILFSVLYKLSFRHVPQMDRKFWADEKCDGCEICARLCPAANIRMVDGKPLWLHRCEQCLACLQWCPQEAIQYGNNTVKYLRYHHPEVTLDDMLEQAKANK